MLYYVTGATGFLGSRVVELLLEQGASVVAFGRNMDQLKRLEALGATFVRAEITDRRALSETIPEGACVIHCAGLTSPWGKEFEYYKTNVLGTQILASVALEKNVHRFIHISTPSIYIEKKSKENIRESDPLPEEMINLYAKTKLQAEVIIDQAVEVGLPAITLRPAFLFGPRDTSIFPRLIRMAQKGFIPVLNEEVKTDFTYVDNVVEAILCALNADEDFIGEKYNITNDEPVNQLQVFESFLSQTGYPVRRKVISIEKAMKVARWMEWFYRKFKLKSEPLVTEYSICVLAYSRTFDIEKAKRELGYRPKYSMKDAMSRTIPWFMSSK